MKESNLTEKEKDKSTDPPSVSGHNSNDAQATPLRKNSPHEVSGRHNTTITRHDKDTINRTLDQISDNANDGFFIIKK